MERDNQHPEYKPYRKRTIAIITKGLSFFIIAGFFINGLWFFWDSFRKILVQEIFLLLLYLFTLFINYIVNKKEWELEALRLYSAAGIATGMFFIFSTGDDYLFVGLIILALFSLISIFSLNRRESALWNILCLIAGAAALYLRYSYSPVHTGYSRNDLIQISLFMLLMSSLLLFLGYSTEGIVKEYINRLWQQSKKMELLLGREKTLRDKYQLVFSMIPDILIMIDRSGRIYDVNRTMVHYTGLSRETLTARNVLDFLPGVDGEFLETTTSRVSGGRIQDGLEVIVSGREEDRTFEISLSSLYEESGEERFLILARDITERKKTELSERSRAEELYIRSITDPLTGLSNRLKLDDFLKGEINKSVRYGSPFSLIICDIDHFKMVNDTYGHSTGDRVLKNLAALLKESVRNTDLSGRWGGEEFLVICPETELEDGYSLAEKIRLAVREMSVPREEKISLSFGVTQFREGDDMEGLLARADKALYRAKETGRDRTVRL